MESETLDETRPELRRDSPSSFESFFRAQFPVVVRIAWSVVGDEGTAEDVAQEVFVAAERRFATFRGPSHAAAWTRVAAVHTALNALRGRRRLEDRQRRAGAVGDTPGPEEQVLAQMSRQNVRNALGRLPRRSAAVLVLRYSGLSYAEVAGALGVGTGQVGTMLRRAEVAFRKEVERGTHS